MLMGFDIEAPEFLQIVFEPYKANARKGSGSDAGVFFMQAFHRGEGAPAWSVPLIVTCIPPISLPKILNASLTARSGHVWL